MAGLAVLLLFLLSVKKELGRAESSLGDIMRQETARAFSNALYHSFVPSFSFIREKRRERGFGNVHLQFKTYGRTESLFSINDKPTEMKMSIFG